MWTEVDWGIFVANISDHILILASHIDDCMITGNSPLLIKAFKDEIGTWFRIMDLGPIRWLLGMKVVWGHTTWTISLSQEPYIKAILVKFNFADMKPVSTPLDLHVVLLDIRSPKTTNEIARMHNIPYRQATGSLIHLTTSTRPVITFTTSYVLQFNANPGWDHWEVIKWIYRYLISTMSLTLTFWTQMRGLVGYVDADGATQEHWQAIMGYMFLIDGGPILWGSKKQELVTLLMAESEYVAATHAAKEDSSIHFLYCPLTDMIANTLTKALPSIKAKHFAFKLGLHSSSVWGGVLYYLLWTTRDKWTWTYLHYIST